MEGVTAGLLVVSSLDLFTAGRIRVVSQHYPWEAEHFASLQTLANGAGCAFRVVDEAFGFALNERNPISGLFEWEHPADTAANMQILFHSTGGSVPA